MCGGEALQLHLVLGRREQDKAAQINFNGRRRRGGLGGGGHCPGQRQQRGKRYEWQP
jgi:hypothetical protein